MGAALLSLALLGLKNARATAAKSSKLNESWYLKYPRIWASFTNPVLHEVNAYQQDKRIADIETKARKSVGIAGDAALKKSATATRDIINQQLNQNIGLLNQQFAGAGRMQSGARMKAVTGLQSSANQSLATAVAQMALQSDQYNRQLAEEHDWRQAQLEASAPGAADKIGDIANLAIQLYGTNPEYFNQKLGDLGEKVGIVTSGGNMFAAPTKELSVDNSLLRPTVVDNTPMFPMGPSVQEAAPSVPSFLQVPTTGGTDLSATYVTEEDLPALSYKAMSNPEVVTSMPNAPEFVSQALNVSALDNKGLARLLSMVNDRNISLEEFIKETMSLIQEAYPYEPIQSTK